MIENFYFHEDDFLLILVEDVTYGEIFRYNGYFIRRERNNSFSLFLPYTKEWFYNFDFYQIYTQGHFVAICFSR